MAIELRVIYAGATGVETGNKDRTESSKTQIITRIFNTVSTSGASAAAKTKTAVLTESKNKANFPDFQATINLPNGVYKGCHQNGVPHGYGVLTFKENDPDKRKVFTGNYKDGKPHGPGVLVWVNGITYTGHFKEGEISGRGFMKWPDDTYTEGTFINGKTEAKRKIKLRFSCGDEYTGEYSEGNFHGKGVYKFANGDRYEGDFLKGKMTGQGTKFNTNGTIFVGTWEDGKWMGGTESYLSDEVDNKKNHGLAEQFPERAAANENPQASFY
jgi:hypothetical protein